MSSSRYSHLHRLSVFITWLSSVINYHPLSFIIIFIIGCPSPLPFIYHHLQSSIAYQSLSLAYWLSSPISISGILFSVLSIYIIFLVLFTYSHFPYNGSVLCPSVSYFYFFYFFQHWIISCFCHIFQSCIFYIFFCFSFFFNASLFSYDLTYLSFSPFSFFLRFP